MEYSGYYIQQTPKGFEVYRSRASWVDLEEPLYIGKSIQDAGDWIDSHCYGEESEKYREEEEYYRSRGYRVVGCMPRDKD